jgi:uncharacterized protein (TIGR02598 family)
MEKSFLIDDFILTKNELTHKKVNVSSFQSPPKMIALLPFMPGIRSGRCRKKAFTLVEVTLALGVVSFALLSLLGLVPMGLVAVRESAQQVACSHIVQKLGGDLAMISRDEVAEYISESRFFDANGKPLPAGSEVAVFVAEFDAGTLKYPGSVKLADLRDHTRIVVTIARAQGSGSSAPAAVVFRTSLSLASSKR